MRHVRPVTLAFSLGLLLAVPTAASADFEGVLKMRTIMISKDQLAGLVEGGAAAATDSEKVFAIPMDRLLALKEKAEVHESTISIKGAKVRTEAGHDQQGYVITDLDQGLSDMVMPDKKQYMEWTKADLQALSAKMEEMQKQMKEHMAGLPPGQRQQMEAMLKNMPGMPGAPEQKPEIKPLGKTQTINSMQTAGYSIHTANETAHGWASKDQPELLRTFKAMQENLERISPRRFAHQHDVRNALSEYGIPVRVQTLGARGYQVEELVEIQKKPVPADTFTVPAGFEKVSPQERTRQQAPTDHPPMGNLPQGHPPVPGKSAE